MILKRRVALGGVQLDSLDDRIIITGVDPAAGKDNFTAVSRAGRPGQRVTGKRRDSLDVTVKFAINIRSDDAEAMQAREEVLEKVNEWAAKGGWLVTGSRPDRRLMVDFVQPPGSGDMFNWTNEYTLLFRAYSVPYWSDTDATTAVSGTTANGSMTIDVPGSAETTADVTIENKSGKTINNVRIKIGGNEFTFGELALGGSDTLKIDHVQTNELYYLRARTADGSVMKKRQAGSANDFTVKPGNASITFTADRAVKVTVSVRGRYV